MSPQQSAAISGRLLRFSLRHRKSSATMFRTLLLALGYRAFSVIGPTVWNLLPDQLRDSDCTESTFWQSLYSSSTSISMLQHIRGVTIMRYIKIYILLKLTYIQSNFAQVQQLLLYPKTLPAAAQKLAEFLTAGRKTWRSSTNLKSIIVSSPFASITLSPIQCCVTVQKCKQSIYTRKRVPP